MKRDPIDFVIAWVDGSDEAWLKEKSKYQADKINEDDSSVRYRDWDNLQYWFRAVEQYAPWVRKIHFVTWGHIPQWLNVEHPRIHIVRHEDFIPQEYLPTFNSHTIELNLHRMEGLAEHFVYFNDDMFLNRALNPENFFKNGLPRDILGLDCIYFSNNSSGAINGNNIRVINDHFDIRECIRKNPLKWINYRYGVKIPAQTLFLLHKNWFPGFYYQHLSCNYLKSTFIDVWNKENVLLDETCRCRFRAATNVNQWLMKYWQLASGQFYPAFKNIGRYYDMGNDISGLLADIKSGRQDIICLNDNKKVRDFEAKRDMVNLAFHDRYLQKSTFER